MEKTYQLSGTLLGPFHAACEHRSKADSECHQSSLYRKGSLLPRDYRILKINKLPVKGKGQVRRVLTLQ